MVHVDWLRYRMPLLRVLVVAQRSLCPRQLHADALPAEGPRSKRHGRFQHCLFTQCLVLPLTCALGGEILT